MVSFDRSIGTFISFVVDDFVVDPNPLSPADDDEFFFFLVVFFADRHVVEGDGVVVLLGGEMTGVKASDSGAEAAKRMQICIAFLATVRHAK